MVHCTNFFFLSWYMYQCAKEPAAKKPAAKKKPPPKQIPAGATGACTGRKQHAAKAPGGSLGPSKDFMTPAKAYAAKRLRASAAGVAKAVQKAKFRAQIFHFQVLLSTHI